jgi:hypothetical protein
VVERQLDRRLLVLVAARFQSPFDGEKLAALEAFDRLLQSAGASWSDLIDATPEQPAPAAAKTKGRGGDDPKSLGCEALARLVVGIATQRRLSPKQQRMMADIGRKVSTAEAVRAAGGAL